jgi:Zn ribbon nucleic-acid-binding protein
MTSPPIDKPKECQGQWVQAGKLCPNCQSVLWSIPLKEGVEVWNTKQLECSKCGHWERAS